MARDLTFEEKRKTSLKADQLLEAYEIGLARDTGNPLNDMTGISGGKPLKPGTPPKTKDLQLPLFDTRPYTKSMMITPNSIMLPFSVKDDTPYSVPGGKSDGPIPTPEEAEDLLERGWSNQMQINPQIAGGPYRMQSDGVTEFWPSDPADRYGPRGASKYDKRIKEMNKIIAPIVNKASVPESNGMLISQAHVEALKEAAKGKKSSKEIRSILKPFTKLDSFGHPTGSFKRV